MFGLSKPKVNNNQKNYTQIANNLNPSKEEQVSAIKTNPLALLYIRNSATDAINTCKVEIITLVMNCLKERNFELCKKIISVLDKNRIDWPQIDAVKKHLK